MIGFDDVPWRHRAGFEVGLVGAVCAGTRFEGMVYGAVRRDGWRATLTIEPKGAVELELEDIGPNPHQPRTRFDETAIQELAASIRTNGVLQPVIVRRSAGGFELVAGERRLRAARLAAPIGARRFSKEGAALPVRNVRGRLPRGLSFAAPRYAGAGMTPRSPDWIDPGVGSSMAAARPPGRGV